MPSPIAWESEAISVWFIILIIQGACGLVSPMEEQS